MPGQSPKPLSEQRAGESQLADPPAISPDSPLRVSCAGGHVVLIKAKYAGRRGRCPVCKGPIEVPGEQRQVQTLDGAADAYSQTLDWLPTPESGEVHIEVEESTIAPRAIGKIGRFELQELLGNGNFGTVYLAFDRQLKRDVALKVPRGGFLNSVEDREKFLREARAAAHLRHANIVPVYEAGVDDNTHYIAMGFVKGTTIKARLDGGWRPAPHEVVRLISKVASALHAAHLSGVIHRDIKPANVLLDTQNEPFVTDFGLARREHAEAIHTIEGALLGTPAYMSPEQARGDGYSADARADLWSVGVMFYELLAGQRPFKGSLTEILKAIPEQEPPRPRAIDPSVPRDLETIALKCLAKQPEQRYPSCQHLVEELQRWELGVPILARQAGFLERSVKWTRRNPAHAALSAALFLMAVVLLASLTAATVRLSAQQKQLTKALADSKANEHLANDNATRAQASERQLSDALNQLGVTTADKAAVVGNLQRLAAESTRNAERVASLTAERDSAAGNIGELSRRNEQLIAELERATSVIPETTAEQLVDDLIKQDARRGYKFGFHLAEHCYRVGRGELANRLLLKLPEGQRDWEWFHLRAMIYQPSQALQEMSSPVRGDIGSISDFHVHHSAPRLTVVYRSNQTRIVTYGRKEVSDRPDSAEWDATLLDVDHLPQDWNGSGLSEDDSCLFLLGSNSDHGASELRALIDMEREEVNLGSPTLKNVLRVFSGPETQLVLLRWVEAFPGEYRFGFSGFRGNVPVRSNPIRHARVQAWKYRPRRIVAVSPDSEIILGAGNSEYECLLLYTLNKQGAYNVRELPIHSLAYGGIYKNWIVAVDLAGVHVWDVSTGNMENNLSLHAAWLGKAGCPLISPSGKRVILSNRLCELTTGDVLLDFSGTQLFGFAPATNDLYRGRPNADASNDAVEVLLAPNELPALPSIPAAR